MECIACNHRSAYNRAVIDTSTGRELGTLCVSCETQKLGELAGEHTNTDESCLYCNRDGFWALPKWVPSTYEDGGDIVSYIDCDVSQATLRLCDEHLAALGVSDIDPAVENRPTITISGETD